MLGFYYMPPNPHLEKVSSHMGTHVLSTVNCVCKAGSTQYTSVEWASSQGLNESVEVAQGGGRREARQGLCE